MLPTGYKLVEYIEGVTGDANIDTGINADDDLRILLDASAINSTTYGGYYAAANQYNIQITTGSYTTMYKGAWASMQIDPTERHLFEQVGNIIYADGVKAVEFTTSSEAESAPLYIMPNGQSRIYSMRIYKADVLVRSYLPCVNPEGVAGFYDLVEGVFVTSESATFHTGADAAAVTFLDMDGTEIFVTAAALNGPARAPVPPAHDGYVFFAWSQSFDYIEADITVSAIYRPIRDYLAAVVYSDGGSMGEIRSVLSCNLTQKLNGECTIDLSTLSNLCAFAATAYKLEILGLVFDITGIDRAINNGVYVTTLHGEHISYRLNDYKINKLIYTGSAERCLAKILVGTPFAVGTIDYGGGITLKINRESTKRDALMQLVGLCGGELEYSGYTIGIRSHVGSTTPISLMDSENVSNISMAADKRNNTESYSIELFKRSAVALGDEVRIVFRPLGIDTVRRIAGIVWDPFNYRNVSVTIGDYQATISDSLYQATQQISDIEAVTAETSSAVSALPLTGYKYLSDNSVEVNGIAYTAEYNDIGLISRITDSNGNSIVPGVGDESITLIDMHNALVWATVISKGIKSDYAPMPYMEGVYALFDATQYNGGSQWFSAVGDAVMQLNGAQKLDGTINFPQNIAGEVEVQQPMTVYVIYRIREIYNSKGACVVAKGDGDAPYHLILSPNGWGQVFASYHRIHITDAEGGGAYKIMQYQWDILHDDGSTDGGAARYYDSNGDWQNDTTTDYRGADPYSGKMYISSADMDSDVLYVAFGSALHTEEQAKANIDFLINKFGIA